MKIGQRAIGNLNPPPDRRFDVEQRDLELVQKIGLRGASFAGLRGHPVKDLCVFRLEELDQPCLDRHQAFLVDAGCVHGGFAGFIVELVQFVPGDANDLRAFPGLLDLFLQGPAQLGELEQCFPLLLGELERIGLAGLLGPLEAEDNRSRIIARQVIDQALLEFLPGLLWSQGLVVVGCHVRSPVKLFCVAITPKLPMRLRYGRWYRLACSPFVVLSFIACPPPNRECRGSRRFQFAQCGPC